MQILITYIHYISIMVLMGSLISEYILLKSGLVKNLIKHLAIVDLLYGIAAVFVLTTGLFRWFYFGKGYDFYISNPLFHIKLTLFIVLAILSVFPTIKILKWRKQERTGENPTIEDKAVRRIITFIRIEFLIIIIIPLLAVLIARGSGV
ncbi:MAG: hypothetical protein B6D61_12350 [Bacteroidetes bacterium 4484_249]|nr:MAG: hypothetical protein B6D61_12350 [Bacteroidetes bacterium 4484_249]